MEKELLDPIHPGEILLEEYMKPLHLTCQKLAEALHVSEQSLMEIVIQQKKGFTAELALRLGRYFSCTPNVWIGLQQEYDLRVASRKLAAELDTIIPRHSGGQ